MPTREPALLEEASYWGRALNVCRLPLVPVRSLFFTFVTGDVISQLSALALCCHAPTPPPLWVLPLG